MQEVEEKLVADGWERRALLLELLRMFDNRLALGVSAADYRLVAQMQRPSFVAVHGASGRSEGWSVARLAPVAQLDADSTCHL